MSSGYLLPDDGEPTIGPVRLPRGRRLTDGGRSEPVIWASDSYLESPGPLWASLQEPAQLIGLVPVILDDLGGQGPTGRPWESGELDGITDTRLEDFDEGEVFRTRWNMQVPVGTLPEADRPPDPWARLGLARPPFSMEEDPEETAYFLAQVAPWGVQFPGLALSELSEIDEGVYRHAIQASASGRIGFVAVDRPADIPHRIGWQGAVNHFMDGDGPTLLSVMMRSWEERFDARLFRLGFDTMQFLVRRPPTSEASAQAVAAEHFAFAGQDSVDSIRGHASQITNCPTWDFWWD